MVFLPTNKNSFYVVVYIILPNIKLFFKGIIFLHEQGQSCARLYVLKNALGALSKWQWQHRVNFLYDKLLCRLQRLIRWGFSDNVFQIWSRYSLLEWRVVPPSATSSHIWAKQTRNKVSNKFYCKKQPLKLATWHIIEPSVWKETHFLL